MPHDLASVKPYQWMPENDAERNLSDQLSGMNISEPSMLKYGINDQADGMHLTDVALFVERRVNFKV